jgi:hypothetical protein
MRLLREQVGGRLSLRRWGISERRLSTICGRTQTDRSRPRLCENAGDLRTLPISIEISPDLVHQKYADHENASPRAHFREIAEFSHGLDP